MESIALREAGELHDQVIPQRAADASVRHFDQRFICAAKFCIGAHKVGIYVDLGHVINDDRDTQTVAIVQDTIKECGFSGPTKAGQDGDRKFLGHLELSLCGFGGLRGAQHLEAVDKFRAGDIAANDNDARLTDFALPVV